MLLKTKKLRKQLDQSIKGYSKALDFLDQIKPDYLIACGAVHEQQAIRVACEFVINVQSHLIKPNDFTELNDETLRTINDGILFLDLYFFSTFEEIITHSVDQAIANNKSLTQELLKKAQPDAIPEA